jgi:hypothetical protein
MRRFTKHANIRKKTTAVEKNDACVRKNSAIAYYKNVYILTTNVDDEIIHASDIERPHDAPSSNPHLVFPLNHELKIHET